MRLKNLKFLEDIMPLISNNVYIIVEASKGIKMTEHFAPWKVKFDVDFDIKPVMTDEEKIAEHQLVGSLMSSELKMGFSS